MGSIDPRHVPYLAAAIGATAAMLTGRERTRIDNLLIGGLFAGFAAYRDPRGTPESTLAVAAIEGIVWGVTDRLVPVIKEKIMPSHAELTA